MTTFLATLLAALSFFPMPDTVSLTVTIIVGQEFVAAGPAGFPCRGIDEVGDIHAGTTVTIHDTHGEMLATGELGPGQRIGTGGDCRFTVVIDDIPLRERYFMSVGTWPGTFYSAEDLARQDWQILLGFGG
jgi:hypothetical protein